MKSRNGRAHLWCFASTNETANAALRIDRASASAYIGGKAMLRTRMRGGPKQERMPMNTQIRLPGRAMLAGLIALTATGMGSAALAASEPQLLVSGRDARTVPVSLSGLDLAKAYDRATLNIRIDRAAQRVCDVNGGSKLDGGPDALACLTQAKAGAATQLARLGLPVPERMAGAGGGR